MSRAPEFIVLTDAAVRAVGGTNSRHAALIEDAFGVLLETPGGGVQLSGDSKSRTQAKRVIQSLASRADQGLDVSEADVRVAIGQARTGAGTAPGGLPAGRRGPGAPQTPAPAPPLKALAQHPPVSGPGPAGPGTRL
ncbi:MAG TPA: PhoH family protein, partial [Phenylobacterium sp.]|nr:PhoH family protein [Phenylobacterium sp.]